MCEPDARAVDLPSSGLATKLAHELDDLPERRRAERLALGEQTAADVDGEPAGKRNGPPAPMIKLLTRFPRLSYFPGRLLGLGFRPEHAPAFARRPMEPAVK